MKVSIVIPNWNGRELLKKNLPQVIASKKYKKNNISEIIVVDDKSEDSSVALLEENYSDEVKIIRHKQNRGFSSSVNTGARSANSSLLCLLNSDVAPKENFLEKTLKHFKDNSVFAVSLNEKGYGPTKGLFENGFVVYEEMESPDKSIQTFWASGGSGVFRRKVWMQLKGMDEKLLAPAYWEDIDICYRAQKRGYKILWEPKGVVEHEHESSYGKLSSKYISRIKERNQLIFIWKNITSPIFFRKHINGLIRRVGRHPGYLRIVFMAISKFRKILKARKKEKKEAKVSDEAIFAKFSK